jgi:recombination protein RecA
MPTNSKGVLSQREEITNMIIALKESGLSVSAVEKETGLSNGLIGKAIKHNVVLSDEKFEKLQKFYVEKCNVPLPIKKTDLVVNGNGHLKEVPSKEAIKAASDMVAKLNKQYGKGTVMFLDSKVEDVYKTVSTGSFGLDIATGIGGFPLGRMVEIYGWESTGKSTIALHAIADAQQQGLNCLYVDAECAFDAKYADALGVDKKTLLYCSPSCGEEALEVVEKMISSGDAKVVIVDSVAALVPRGELEGQMGDSKMGVHAKLMSQSCRKLTDIVQKNDALIIFINQLRHKIGVVYGSPEVTTGGNALKFYASMRMDVRRSTTKENSIIGENGEKEGNLTTVTISKNKCAPPFQSAAFNIIYGKGIDKTEEILTAAIESGIIKKEGNTYYYEKTKIGVGIEATKQFLSDNLEIVNEIETKLKS